MSFDESKVNYSKTNVEYNYKCGIKIFDLQSLQLKTIKCKYGPKLN